MDTVTVETHDSVALVRIDDGKANALSHVVVDALLAALDAAEAEGRAVCIVGRPGVLSAGFDLDVMTAGPDAARELLRAGGRLFLRLYGFPRPTVVAVTGHALAAGLVLVTACDTRIGAAGSFKLAFNEVAIGIALPAFATEMARDRVGPALTRVGMQAEMLDPHSALAVGVLDRVVPADECEAAALAEARRLAQLPADAYARSKRAARGATIERLVATLDDDTASVSPPSDGRRARD
jgi:enoyl-CoA hydratase